MTTSSSPPCRVLYVEDNVDACDLIHLLLTEAGYEVSIAHSAREGIATAQRQQFELYVLDNWLPDLSGVELLKRLREFDPNTPVVFYSAAGYEADRKSAMEAGAQAYLVKPADLMEFVQTVSRTIEEAKEAGLIETACEPSGVH